MNLEVIKEKIKNNKVIIILGIIIIIAIALRFSYILETPYYRRQHDLGTLENSGGLKYIYTIYETGNLPTTKEGQFYHPPLHHLLAAGFLRICSLFTTNETILFEMLQILPCLYSILLIFCAYKILKELKFNFYINALILFIMAIHPTYIILSGSLNNDMLSILLIHVVILQTIRWYKSDNLKNTIILAIITGAAVMTKTSGAIVAPAISLIFIWKIIEEIKKNKKYKTTLKKYIPKFLIFGLISLPIGLWYPIRNYILFNQPILYVMDPLDVRQYYGLVPFIDRITPNISSILSVYHNSYINAENIYGAVIKTSLFGEYKFATSGILYNLAEIAVAINFFVGLFIPIIIISKLISNIKNKSKNLKWNVMLVVLIATNIISFLIMQKELPYGCSEDFRYLVPSIFISLTLIGFILKDEKNRVKKQLIMNIYILIIFVLILADIVMFTHLQ